MNTELFFCLLCDVCYLYEVFLAQIFKELLINQLHAFQCKATILMIELLFLLIDCSIFVWLQEELTLSLLDKCKQSLYVIKEIVQSTTNDEETLFEALYLNDELQQLVSKYEELEASQSLGEQQTQNADDTSKHDAEAVQNLNERHEGDKSEEAEAAQNLDQKLPQKSNTLEGGVNATEVYDHVETKNVDSTKEKNGEPILKTNTE